MADLITHDLVDAADLERLKQELRQTKRSLAQQQERLRNTINGGAVVRSIGHCIGTLIAGEESRLLGEEIVSVPLSAERVTALRAAMDGSLRLLDKLLPSLKSVEVDSSVGGVAPAGTVIKVVTNVPRDPRDPYEQAEISFI